MRLDSLCSSSSDTHGADMRVLRREHLVTARAARAFAALVVCRLRALFPPQDFCGFNQTKNEAISVSRGFSRAVDFMENSEQP